MMCRIVNDGFRLPGLSCVSARGINAPALDDERERMSRPLLRDDWSSLRPPLPTLTRPVEKWTTCAG
jgi:hypothetical protein